MNHPVSAWIAWEKQRRSVELAKHFGCKSFFYKSKQKGLLRYIDSTISTIKFLRKTQPKVLFVQNPSMILTALACSLKPFFNYTLIVDRHTNFKLDKRSSNSPKWKAFFALSNWTLRHSDLTIVTNKYLKLYVQNLGGKATVLQDKLPYIPEPKEVPERTLPHKAFIVCSFQEDEAYREIIEAAKDFPNVSFYFSGNYKKAFTEENLHRLPDNVVLLGFVSDEDYAKHLWSCTFTIILTNLEFVLNCGSYESISAGKPMVLSGTRTIRSYFSSGATYVDDFSPSGIKKAIHEMVANHKDLDEEVKISSGKLRQDWDKRAERIESFIETRVTTQDSTAEPH